CLQHDNYPRTF
nr:immunoglobulin light chain junction region [Macaca mulatta]MOW33727.1 immunoglobulin light chain junction region [Macaca mulatta]MOW33746.1 immunoglobulin light chain junction region [Macaca mulatta]MOW33767.1 immunoglobulin light chain junction region [Macaca mulatta]MOW33772.1 immunoglobulin light chain junction region [Macaca mulatta]